VKIGVEKTSGLLPSQYTPTSDIIYEYFVKGTEPTEISKLFIKPPTPSGFTGAYVEESDQIILSWSYPDKERENYAFELQFSVNNSEFKLISSLEEMQHIILNPEGNATYSFKLQAVSIKNDQLRSDVIDLSIDVPEKEEDKAAREEKEQEEKARIEKEEADKLKEEADKAAEKEEIPDPLADLEPEPEPEPDPEPDPVIDENP